MFGWNPVRNPYNQELFAVFYKKIRYSVSVNRDRLLDFKCTIMRPFHFYSHLYRYRTVQVTGIQKKSKKNGDAPSELNHF